jgi:hypothetical protein
MSVAARLVESDDWVVGSAILFPLHVRLTTWLALAVFLCVAARRRDHGPLLAAAAWLFGFEAVFQVVDVATGFPLHWPGLQFFVLVASFVATSAVVIVLTWRGVRPDLRLLVAALLVMAVWIATGFHVNDHAMRGFNPWSEALNEISKLLWAAAYFVPQLRMRGKPISFAVRLPSPGP